MFEQGDTNLKRRLLEGDLLMLQQSMKSHPKVYWLWNHRRWCLCLLPSSDVQDKGEKWRQELRLVNMMLEMDHINEPQFLPPFLSFVLHITGWKQA